MKTTKGILTFSLIIAIVFGTLTSCNQKKPIIGKWEIVQTKDGKKDWRHGYDELDGVFAIFKEDGNICFDNSQTQDDFSRRKLSGDTPSGMKWSIEGAQIIIKCADANRCHEHENFFWGDDPFEGFAPQNDNDLLEISNNYPFVIRLKKVK